MLGWSDIRALNVNLDKRLQASDVRPEVDGREGYIFGWVHEIRDLGSLVFMVIRDNTGLCQVSFKANDVGEEVMATLKELTKESVVVIKGVIKREPKARAGVEVKGTEIKVLSKAVAKLPYDVVGKVSANLDTRLDHRILDLRRPENRAIFLICDTVLSACKNYLRQNGFVEVRTPRLISTATEGGAALFEVNYFDRKAYLAQSPQLYKEELITVFERVFEIGPFFRAEESHTRRHISEFTSIDIEAAFMDYRDVMNVLEGMVVNVFEAVLNERKKELELLGVELKVPKRPFKRMSYDEALKELSELGVQKEWGDDFTTPELRKLASINRGFYFITEFPTKVKPFYCQPVEEKPEISESFDLMYQWLELASGSTRISDRALLEQKIKESGLDPKSFEHHLKIYDYGMPFHAGWGLGLERLLMVITRRTNIREAVLFPRDKFRLVP